MNDHVIKVAILGYGSIGRSIVERLDPIGIPGVRLVAVMMRTHQLEQSRSAVPSGVLATDSLEAVLRLEPEVIVEAAGQAAVRQCGAAVLTHGREFMVLSIGAFADDELAKRLIDAARRSGGRISVPAGALAGFDGLLSMREAGLSAVTYRSTKPVAAWKGTPADRGVYLARLTEPTVIFSGSAREAAIQFPKNANLGVAVGIATLGLDQTKVELVADPHATLNVGQVIAQGVGARLDVTVTNGGFGTNPKSSQITGLSVIAALANRYSAFRFQ